MGKGPYDILLSECEPESLASRDFLMGGSRLVLVDKISVLSISRLGLRVGSGDFVDLISNKMKMI